MSNIQNAGGAKSNQYEPTDYSSAEGLSGKKWAGTKKAIDNAYEKWAERKGIKTAKSFNYGNKNKN